MKSVSQKKCEPGLFTCSGVRLFVINLIAAITCYSSQVMAAFPGPKVEIDLEVLAGEFLYPAFVADRQSTSVVFSASVEVPVILRDAKADLYIGVMALEDDKPYSWTKSATGNSSFLAGMHPLLSDVALSELESASISELAGSNMEYFFNGTEAPGLYTVFLIVVGANTDPGDPIHWMAAEMQPFFIK